MVGSSAIVGWVENSGRGSIKQFLLQGYSPAEVVANKGELQFTEVPPVVVYHKGAIYVAFQLKFALRLTHQQIILAKSDITPIQNRLPIHNDKRSITVEFSSGTVPHASANFEKLKRNHGILNVIGWGILLPCGAIVARYFKRLDPQWYYLHTSIQFVGFVIGLLGFAAGRYLYNKTHANFQVHRGIGIFVVLLSMLQVVVLSLLIFTISCSIFVPSAPFLWCIFISHATTRSGSWLSRWMWKKQCLSSPDALSYVC